MIRKTIVTTLSCFLMAGIVSAQRSNNKNNQQVIYKEDRYGGVMDAHSFYKTPYRSRNNGTYSSNRSILNIGFGFPNTLHENYNYYSGGRSGFGPVLLKYELAVREEIGVGVVLDAAYSQFRYYKNSYSYSDKALGTGVSFLGYYHFNKFIPLRRLDVYAGLGVNISHVRVTNDYTNSKDGFVDVLPAVVLGARYYFRPDLAPYLELGRTNYSYANIGISLNL